MGKSYFIWNGIDCRTMGITLAGPVGIVRPEERIEHVQIPGRSGDLTMTEGDNIFNSYIQTATIQVRGGAHARDVWRWLRGSGYVTFSGEPDRRQKARIIGAITLDKQSHNLDYWVGECQFYCQPLKELLNEGKVTVSSSPSTVINAGDVRCKPLYKVTASSTGFTFKATGDDAPASNTIAVSGTTSSLVYWVDSETMEVWNADKTVLLTKYSSGQFPVLGQGANSIIGDGWSSIEIERRERFL